MNDSHIAANHPKRYGVRILIALGIAWLAAILGWLLLFGAPHIIPNCKVAGKTTPTQCGALTPWIDGALEWYFDIGIFLYGLTIPWLLAGIVIAVIEARRARASA
jgi:hypothetical protein